MRINNIEGLRQLTVDDLIWVVFVGVYKIGTSPSIWGIRYHIRSDGKFFKK